MGCCHSKYRGQGAAGGSSESLGQLVGQGQYKEKKRLLMMGGKGPGKVFSTNYQRPQTEGFFITAAGCSWGNRGGKEGGKKGPQGVFCTHLAPLMDMT